MLWLPHFKNDLYLTTNEFTGTLPTDMGNMNKLGKLLCTHCLNSLMDFVLCMIICISFVMNTWFEYGEYKWTKISNYLQVLWLSHFNVLLYLYSKEITGPLPTEMGKMNQLFKLCCTHYLNSLMNFVSCLIICIYFVMNIWFEYGEC